jgi:hypothetical protein
MPVDATEADIRIWEISEVLHRQDLTALERSEHEDEWIGLTSEQRSPAQVEPVKSRRKDGRGIRDAGFAHPAFRRYRGFTYGNHTSLGLFQ